MARSAIVLGGTGQIGVAASARLLAAGWEVTVVSRGDRPIPRGLLKPGVRHIKADRRDEKALRRAVGAGADALVDIVAYDANDGRQLLELQEDLGSLVVLSSSSVYQDAKGRTLDEARTNGFPDLPDPIPERQPIVAPGEATYSTRKAALETVLSGARAPVTVLRPGAIHGVGSHHPREWWFVKRMLDGRAMIPLAHGGASRFHTTSVLNIAALIETALDRPSTRTLNIADPTALTVRQIGEAIAKSMAYYGRLVDVRDGGWPSPIGRTPWSTPRPFVLDTRAARALGYLPVTDYAATASTICEDLVTASAKGDWRALFPVLAGYPYDQFDYAAEDAALALS